MAATQNIRLTLPSAVAEEFERVRKAERRTPEALVREAVSSYLSFLRQFPEVPATRAELRAIRRGRPAYARGDYVDLDEALNSVERGRGPARRKKSRQVSHKG
jgi:hypothetical protein